MKKVESIHFNETIFIPARHKFEGDYPYWFKLGTITRKTESGKEVSDVEVVIINCHDREEISGIFDKEINMLKGEIGKHPEKKEVFEKQIGHFENLKNKIREDSVYRKEPPRKLLEFLKMKGFPYLYPKKVIFISGVGNIVEE